MKNAKIEPPTGSEDSRADKLKARRHPRPECRLDKQRFPDTIGPAGQPAEKNNPDALAGQPANQPAANPDMKARIDQPTKGQHWWDYEPTPSAASLDKIPVRLSGQPATRPPANPDTQTGQPVNQTPAKKNPDVPSGQPAERKSHEKLSGQPASRPVEKNPDALPVQPASRPAEDWRSALLAEFRNASREELLAVMEKNQCAVVGVNDPVVAKRILGQSVLMRTFGEPHGCNLGKPDEEAHALLREFLSNNIMESMLVVQMSGVHEAALAFLKAAGEPGLSQRQRDAEMRRAKQLMHLFNAQAAMMTKLKNQDWDRKRTGRQGAEIIGSRAVYGHSKTNRRQPKQRQEIRRAQNRCGEGHLVIQCRQVRALLSGPSPVPVGECRRIPVDADSPVGRIAAGGSAGGVAG